MSMSFLITIPKDQIPLMKKILDLNENQKKIIVDQFKSFKSSNFEDKVKPIEELEDFPLIFDLLIILFRLNQNLQEDQIFKYVDEFIYNLTEDFVQKLKSENYQFESNFDEKFQSMKKFLKDLLAMDTFLFYVEKARSLLIERSRLIRNTRIITDIRPVFREEKIDSPNYCVITHNLKVEYSKDLENTKKAYYALDHQDLIQLQKHIERALEKESEMRKLCQKAGMDVLEV